MNVGRKLNVLLKKLLLLGNQIYYVIPYEIRFIFIPVQKVITFFRINRSQQWLITGEEINSRKPMSILFTGTQENKNYLSSLAYSDIYKEQYLGVKWLRQVTGHLKQAKSVYNLVVTEIPTSSWKQNNNEGSFCIPCWIRGKAIDTRKDIDSRAAKETLKSDIRRITRNKLQYEVTTKISWYNRFYHEMYVPYITNTYGKTAIILDYDNLKILFKDCELLLVKQGEEYIAGTLIHYTKNETRLLILGIKDGNYAYIKLGVIGALYYFALIYQREKGYSIIDLGGSRAFLNDGLLNYKNKWDPRIGGNISNGLFYINTQTNNEAVRGFLINNPFIFIDDNGFNGAIFFGKDTKLEEGDLFNIEKRYFLDGMSRLYIYRFDNQAIDLQEKVPAQLAERIFICQAKE